MDSFFYSSRRLVVYALTLTGMAAVILGVFLSASTQDARAQNADVPDLPGEPNLYQNCSALNNTISIPTGFGASFNLFAQARELVLKVGCQQEGIRVEVGSGQQNQYLYKQVYAFRNGEWVPKTLRSEGELLDDNWFVGSGWTTYSIPSGAIDQFGYVLGYICTWTGSQWKCGCRDSACRQNYWQMQAYRAASLGAGGGTGAGADCSVNPNHADYCKLCGPCGAGEGDCDNNNECSGNLECYQREKATHGTDVDFCRQPGGGVADGTTITYEAERDLLRRQGTVDSIGITADPGTHDEGHLVSGPYAENWGSGTRVVTYYLKNSGGDDGERIARIEVYDATDDDHLVRRNLTKEHFDLAGNSVWPFRVVVDTEGREGNVIETHVWWYGNSRLTIDKVVSAESEGSTYGDGPGLTDDGRVSRAATLSCFNSGSSGIQGQFKYNSTSCRQVQCAFCGVNTGTKFSGLSFQVTDSEVDSLRDTNICRNIRQSRNVEARSEYCISVPGVNEDIGGGTSGGSDGYDAEVRDIHEYDSFGDVFGGSEGTGWGGVDKGEPAPDQVDA